MKTFTHRPKIYELKKYAGYRVKGFVDCDAWYYRESCIKRYRNISEMCNGKRAVLAKRGVGAKTVCPCHSGEDGLLYIDLEG